MLTEGGLRWGRRALAGVLIGCTLPFFLVSSHWPLVGDASLIHYICFLMDHGMAPYRDTGDMNMPMAFLIEWAAMHSFGPGDVAWRCFDFFVLAMGAGAMAAIGWRRDRLAVVFAACLFVLIHGRDGFAQAGQRDLVLAVNLLVATALLFLAVRHDRPGLAAGFGLFAGLAAAVKPTALPLALVLFGLAAVALRQRGVRVRGYGWAALAGGSAAPLASLAMLLRQHSLGAFVHGLHTVVPFYVSLGHRPLGFLLLHSVSPVLALVLLWLATLAFGISWSRAREFRWAGLDRAALDWERTALLCGTAFGLGAYLWQARGFPYYRYPLMAFLLPLMGLDFGAAIRRGWSGGRCAWVTAAAGLAVGAIVIAPMSIVAISRFDPGSLDFNITLEQELQRLGGAALTGDIQCIDSVSGCGTTLYRMRLVQATGVLSDFLLFGSMTTPASGPQPPVLEQTRARYSEAVGQRPPRVIVVTAWLHIDGPGEYGKLERWPALAAMLARDYRLETEWRPTRPERWWSRPVWPSGYRVYLRNDKRSLSQPLD